jgi:hypothetical protein
MSKTRISLPVMPTSPIEVDRLALGHATHLGTLYLAVEVVCGWRIPCRRRALCAVRGLPEQRHVQQHAIGAAFDCIGRARLPASAVGAHRVVMQLVVAEHLVRGLARCSLLRRRLGAGGRAAAREGERRQCEQRQWANCASRTDNGGTPGISRTKSAPL